MTGPAKRSGAGSDKPSVDTCTDEAGADNGSDPVTSAGAADADESGYRRDDYWRAAQEGREADAGQDAMRQRDAVSGAGNDAAGSSGDEAGAVPSGAKPSARNDG